MFDANSLFIFYFQVETLTFLGILLFFIVIGNSAVLAALMMGKTQRKSRMNFFIMHLALAGNMIEITVVFWNQCAWNDPLLGKLTFALLINSCE